MPVINDTNKHIDFNEGGAEITATLAKGTYDTAAEVATEIQTKMNNAVSGEPYTVSYSDVNEIFTITTTGTLNLLWNDGTNHATSVAPLIGYDQAANDTGSNSYDADFVRFFSLPGTPAHQMARFVAYKVNPKVGARFDAVTDLDELSEPILLLDNKYSPNSYIVEYMKVGGGKFNGIPIIPDKWKCYLGSDTGKVYTYDADYESDDGENITAIYVTKVMDFADQLPQYIDKDKTIYKVKLIYKDLEADTAIKVYLSNDGGETWSSSTKTIGTGDGGTKHQDYDFISTGQFFQFKVENISADKIFCYLGLYIFFTPGGEYLEV